MAFWPTDERTTSNEHTVEEERDRNYPYLEPGLIGAATLVEESNKHLRWAFVATPSDKGSGIAINHFDKCVNSNARRI